jgi:hypothetical protein
VGNPLTKKPSHSEFKRQSASIQAALSGSARRYDSFKEFLLREVPTDKGKYSFAGHRVFEPIVDDLDAILARRQPDMQISLLKGAQIGASTIGIGVSAFLPSQVRANVGYFLPTDKFADRFDKTRFRPAIRKSPYLRGLMREGTYQGSALTGLKEFGSNFLYTLGLTSLGNAISIPLDACLYDEVDVLPEENMEWSDDRIAASDLRFRFYFSVGMLPGLGIDRFFQAGSQTLWVVKCPSCGKDGQVLEDLFPACVARVGEEWARVCVKCGAAYDVEAAGRWVDTYPDRRKDGLISYRVPQLIVPAIALSYIMARWEKAKLKRSKKAKFNCSALGRPDGGDAQPITDAVLTACRGDYAMTTARGPLPRFAGVDCGDTAHFACHERLPDGRKRFIYAEEMDSDEMVERINQLWDMLGLAGLVCDSKPLRVEARKIAYAHPREVWLQDFAEGDTKAEEKEHQGKVFQHLRVSREESLSDLVDLMVPEEGGEPQVLLPRKDADSPAILDVIDIHLKNLRKEKTINATGNTVDRFVRTAANHFAMAMNSSLQAEYLALGKLLGMGPIEYQSVEKRRFAGQVGAY